MYDKNINDSKLGYKIIKTINRDGHNNTSWQLQNITFVINNTNGNVMLLVAVVTCVIITCKCTYLSFVLAYVHCTIKMT